MNVGAEGNIAQGKITHYGVAQKVYAYVDTNCFYTHGKIAYMDLESGKAVASSNGIIYLLKTGVVEHAGTSSQTIVAQEDGGKIIIPEKTAVKANDSTGDGVAYAIAGTGSTTVPVLGYNTTEKTESGTTTYTPVSTEGTSRNNNYEISTLADLEDWRDSVNNGFSYVGISIKLMSDITLNGEWVPVGNKNVPFVGTFDGNGHTISGLTNGNMTFDASLVTVTEKAQNKGCAYGFFGIVGDAAGNKVEIKNLTLDKVSISSSKENEVNMVGALFGGTVESAKVVSSCSSPITLSNINTSGSITISNKSGCALGGIAGKIYTSGAVSVKNCINDVSLTAVSTTGEQNKTGGITALLKNSSNVTIEDCLNKAEIESSGYSATALASIQNITVQSIQRNGNTGNIKLELGHSYVALFDDETDKETNGKKLSINYVNIKNNFNKGTFTATGCTLDITDGSQVTGNYYIYSRARNTDAIVGGELAKFDLNTPITLTFDPTGMTAKYTDTDNNYNVVKNANGTWTVTITAKTQQN